MEYLQKYKLYFSTFYIHALSVHPYIRKKQEHFRTPASLSDQPRLPPRFYSFATVPSDRRLLRRPCPLPRLSPKATELSFQTSVPR